MSHGIKLWEKFSDWAQQLLMLIFYEALLLSVEWKIMHKQIYKFKKKSNLNWKKWVIGWLTVKIMENHKITAWIRLEGTTVGHLVQIACSSMVTIEHIAQACIQKVLEYLQWKWTFNSYSIIIYLLCSAVADLITEDFQETRFLFWHFFFHCTNLGSQHHKNKWLG